MQHTDPPPNARRSELIRELAEFRQKIAQLEALEEERMESEERYMAERRRAQDTFRLVTEAAPNAMTMVDSDGAIVMVNNATEKMFGYDRSELLGQKVEMLIPEQSRCKHVSYRSNYLKCPSTRAMGAGRDLFGRHKDGKSIPIEIGLNPIALDDGNYVLASIIDITERKRIEQQEQQARTAAVEAEMSKARERTRAEFLARMSHEIRSPLNAVVAMSEYLLDTELNASQREIASTIRSAGEALMSIVNDILDFSKLEAGKLHVEAIDFELAQIVHECLGFVAAQAHKKGLGLFVVVDPNVPLMVRADPARLRQVLLNLTQNAVKFTERGGVTVRVSCSSDSLLSFSVSDTGIGISEAAKKMLFQPFSQGDVSTTRKFGGTGLGLAIAQRTVQALGGAMTFESVEGRGSIFRFSIPFRNPQQSPIITWCLRLPRFEGLSIGVVDDNQVDRNGMVEQLQKWGLEATGYECPAGIREHELLLVTNRLKEHVHCACPVICLYRVTESIENGPSLRKPCHPQLLLSAVSNELSAVSPVSVNQGADNSRGSLVNHSPVQSLLSTILVVEDNPVNQRVAELLLSKLGHEYHITNNGAEALKALEKCPYDLVLMDCEMPVMDGFAAAAAIRKIEGELLHTPIVAMTAHALEGDRQRCVESGMDDYLSKPIDQRRLSVMIDKWSTPLNSHRLEFVKRDLGSDCVVDLMREFARDTGNVVEMAKQIISGNGAQDLQALAKAVHFLKGCCQYCGAQRLYGICKRICAACKTGEQADFEQISWLCRKLIAEYDAAVAAMAEFSP